jgi:hypothetical protein
MENSTLQIARRLTEKGFYIFPCIPNAKEPAIKGWQEAATRNNEQITKWFANDQYNIGIFTGKFRDNESLVVVDVDQKKGKDGAKEIEKLQILGHEFPATFLQTTPTGGKHIVYKTTIPVKQGADVLAKGLDIRSRGGYIVAVGSKIDGGFYSAKDAEIVPAPDWIIQKCGYETKTIENKPVVGVDIYGAIQRAKSYLEAAPLAVEGEAGDQTTYRVACTIKDFGVDERTALGVLCDYWNNRCSPPWPVAELKQKIAHAYRYGNTSVGSTAPEADFQPIATVEGSTEYPDTGEVVPRINQIEKVNEDHAFIRVGGGYVIIQETHDIKGHKKIVRMGELTFHKVYASRLMQQNGKMVPVTKVWINHGDRRSYDGFCFAPEQQIPANVYNLWKGFSVEPAAKGEVFSNEAVQSVEMFKEHALQNICAGDVELCKWLIGYFAHLIQRPYEKPLTALVFKGRKGTGKNALVERVGRLIAPNFLVTADKRYLVSNFNSFLENNLMLVLDEAFWSGDKQAEGITKNLITGAEHMIEHKGEEPYPSPNLTRVIIIGNEEWLVPATQDERRFAVFNVGDGRRKDNKFFETMRVGMENGGYRLLLTFLKDFDISGIDINTAPSTQGLLEQKHESLDAVSQWWLANLIEGEINGSGFGETWPDIVLTKDLYNAYIRYAKERRISGWMMNNVTFGKKLRRISGIETKQRRVDGEPKWHYYMVDVETARKNWSTFIGHEVNWEALEKNE